MTAASPSRKTALAVACVAVWVVAAAASARTGIWIGIGGAAIALGIAILVFDGAGTRALLQPTTIRLAIGVAVGGAMAAVTYLVYPLLADRAPFVARDTERLYAAFHIRRFSVAALALLPVVLGEELVWRGVVQDVLSQRFGRSAGVLVAAAIYALAHLPLGSPVLVVVAFACATTWGLLRVATRSLIPTLVAHLLWDALVMLWLPLIHDAPLR